MALTGRFWVRVIGPAIFDAKRLWPATKHRMEVRRHALKLRFWPEPRPTAEHGEVLDLDWEWIKSLHGERIGELRVQDEIGGVRNARIIFYVHELALPGDPLPCVWILAALHKKRDDFTRHNIATFKARKLALIDQLKRKIAKSN